MKTAIRCLLVCIVIGTVACLIFNSVSCKTVPAPKVPTTIITPVVAAIDCALPSLWAAFTPDAVARDVVAAVQQDDPIAALEALGESAGEAEVTCVAAKMASTIKMAVLSIDGGATKSIPQQWLDHEASKGLYVTNFATLGQ